MSDNRWAGLGPMGVALLAVAALVVSCGEPEGVARIAGPASAARAPGSGGKITVSAADPDTVPIDTTLTVMISGTGFVPGDTDAKVNYLIGGTTGPRSEEVTATEVTVLSPTQIQTTTQVTKTADLGRYSIEVLFTGGKRGVGAEKVEVVAKPVLLGEPKGMTSHAVDVNDDGVIVGALRDGSGNSYAVRWRPQNGGWIAEDLGAGSATAVNGNGEILVNRGSRAHVRLDGGAEADLGEGTRGESMSEDGTVVGFMRKDGTSKAVLWPRTGNSWGSPVTIPGVAEYDQVAITAISHNGRWISGWTANIGETYVGMAWEWNGTNVAGPYLVDVAEAQPQAVSNDGAIAGVVWLPCETPGFCNARPVFWPSHGGTRQLIPNLHTGVATIIYDMNDSHQMVGMGPVPIPTNGRKSIMSQQPAFWPTPATDVVDLSAFTHPRMGRASAIDGVGRLVVGSIDDSNGISHAIAWILP